MPSVCHRQAYDACHPARSRRGGGRLVGSAERAGRRYVVTMLQWSLLPAERVARTVEHAMAIAEPPRRTASPYDAHTRATSPLRVYAADQQPIRLLAELLGIAPAELVHRAIIEYLRQEQPRIAEVARSAQGAFEAGDFEALARALSAAAETRSARRRERLDRLSRPAEGQ